MMEACDCLRCLATMSCWCCHELKLLTGKIDHAALRVVHPRRTPIFSKSEGTSRTTSLR